MAGLGTCSTDSSCLPCRPLRVRAGVTRYCAVKGKKNTLGGGNKLQVRRKIKGEMPSKGI